MRIAVASANGGTGRTTLVLNLGLSLCERGLKVLMVDLDPQGCLGLLLARKDDEWAGLADLLMGRATLEKAVKKSNLPLLSLLPRGRLAPGDVPEFEQSVRRPKVLEAALRNLDASHDVILLDLPAGIGQITRGAFAVAHELILTARAEPLARRSLDRILQVVDRVREGENTRLGLMGILPTFVTELSTYVRDVLHGMRSDGLPVFQFPIPISELFVRACERGQPLRRFTGRMSPEVAPIEAVAEVIASRLRGEVPSLDVPGELATAGRYLSFNAARFGAVRPVHAPVGVSLDLDLSGVGRAGAFGSDEWNGFLDVCLRATGCETALVVDHDGLAVASRGRLGHGLVEALSTRLSIAFEQAARMDIAAGEVQSIVIEFDHLQMTGVAVRSESGRRFTIGFLGREAVPGETRLEIAERLGERLTELWTETGVGDELVLEDVEEWF